MEECYLDLLKEILEKGQEKNTRAGKTIALFAKQLRFDLTKGFPAITTKKLAFDAVKSELIWFLDGGRDTGYRMNNNKLKQILGRDKTIWTANEKSDYWRSKAKTDGDMGRIYGAQWRNWNGEIDQIKNLLDKLKTDPDDRRIIVSAWNPSDLDDMALPPCHILFQIFHINGEISLHMYQRSCDMFLGVPFNIASYALLLEMIAQLTNKKAKELVITLGDVHIYENHIDQIKEQLSREVLKAPTLELNKNIKDIDKFKMNDINLRNYNHHGAIKAEMAV